MPALLDLKGVVVIDEIQRTPNIVKGASESLAGRMESIPVSGFGTAFTRPRDTDQFPFGGI
jgi:hypothetical protein